MNISIRQCRPTDVRLPLCLYFFFRYHSHSCKTLCHKSEFCLLAASHDEKCTFEFVSMYVSTYILVESMHSSPHDVKNNPNETLWLQVLKISGGIGNLSWSGFTSRQRFTFSSMDAPMLGLRREKETEMITKANTVNKLCFREVFNFVNSLSLLCINVKQSVLRKLILFGNFCSLFVL